MKEYPNEENEPIISKLSDIDLTGFYSYSNYLRWGIDERLELIKGRIYEMRAPSMVHQKVLTQIFGPLFLYFKKHRCQVFVAPFDIRLTHQSTADDAITTVVQPDVCVICNESKLDARGCLGAPDIVVEILSPGNNKKELNIKYHLYEEFGVKEYWVVHPIKKSMMKYTLNKEGKYEPGGQFKAGDQLTSNLLPGFILDLNEVFNR